MPNPSKSSAQLTAPEYEAIRKSVQEIESTGQSELIVLLSGRRVDRIQWDVRIDSVGHDKDPGELASLFLWLAEMMSERANQSRSEGRSVEAIRRESEDLELVPPREEE